MDRRTFNTTLLGGALATALPVPSVAATARHATLPLYAWGVAIARAQNRASPALLAQQLGISQAAASELYASMIANGVLRAPLFGGIAKAAQPLFNGGHIVASEAHVTRSATAKLKDLKRGFDKLIEEKPAEGVAEQV